MDTMIQKQHNEYKHSKSVNNDKTNNNNNNKTKSLTDPC